MISVVSAVETKREIVATVQAEVALNRWDSLEEAIESAAKKWARDQGYTEVVSWKMISKQPGKHEQREGHDTLFHYIYQIEVVVAMTT